MMRFDRPDMSEVLGGRLTGAKYDAHRVGFDGLSRKRCQFTFGSSELAVQDDNKQVWLDRGFCTPF